MVLLYTDRAKLEVVAEMLSNSTLFETLHMMVNALDESALSIHHRTPYAGQKKNWRELRTLHARVVRYAITAGNSY
jgi:hypothetical protein